uniref:Secreted protein n=1 Tax=Rhipicephalus appendiculatus TaxID=34631 RepID=A0A131YCG8_RHIAP
MTVVQIIAAVLLVSSLNIAFAAASVINSYAISLRLRPPAVAHTHCKNRRADLEKSHKGTTIMKPMLESNLAFIIKQGEDSVTH